MKCLRLACKKIMQCALRKAHCRHYCHKNNYEKFAYSRQRLQFNPPREQPVAHDELNLVGAAEASRQLLATC